MRQRRLALGRRVNTEEVERAPGCYPEQNLSAKIKKGLLLIIGRQNADSLEIQSNNARVSYIFQASKYLIFISILP